MYDVTTTIGPSRVLIDYSKLDGTVVHFVEHALDEFCRLRLTTMKQERRFKIWVQNRKYFIKKKHKQFIIPITFYPEALEKMQYAVPSLVINETKTEYVPRKLTFTFDESVEYRPGQPEAIDFLISNKGKRSGLELQTGKGKTLCAIRAAYKIGDIPMVVVNGLVDQWVESIKKYTSLQDDDMCVIQGLPSLLRLLRSDKKPQFFVVSLATMRKYVNQDLAYSMLMPYDKFIEHYGIGTKIVDEAHLCFHATSLIDMSGDVKTSIYLTATFLTADVMLKKLFSMYFPNQMRYDGGADDKYTDMFVYIYPGVIETAKTIFMGQYSHGRFEKILLWNKAKLFDRYIEKVLVPIIDKHFKIREYPGKKLLIFFYLKDSIYEAAKILKRIYPQYKVVTYVAEDAEENLQIGDMVLSTLKGAGTGTDIPKLITVINTISFSAETSTRQTFGRLREIKGFETHYIDIVDGNNSVQNRHLFIRKSILRMRAKQIRESSIWW